MKYLHIHMLGEFSLQFGENKISASSSRSKKVWLLLAYLIYHKGRVVSRQELVQLLWGIEHDLKDPENTLKITLYRTRALLDQLWPSAGRELILYQKNGYAWNMEIPIKIDIMQFELLCLQEYADEEEQLQAFLNALDLYQNDFLQNFISESWVMPITIYFHNLYVQTTLKAGILLVARGRQKEAVCLYQNALQSEPYHELLHQQLMQTLLDMGDRKGAAAVYDVLSQRLLDDFGIKPNAEICALYRLATQDISSYTIPMDVVIEEVQEKGSVEGALKCEYDFFRVLCFAEARSMLRSGKAAHVVLLTVIGQNNELLEKQDLECVMENLQEQIQINLRHGDAFACCSVCQFILLLPAANYEDSCMVCRRVLAAFQRKYPYIPVTIRFVVQPLIPHTTLTDI